VGVGERRYQSLSRVRAREGSDDDPAGQTIQTLVQGGYKIAGHAYLRLGGWVNYGASALAKVRTKAPDLILLDRMLPGINDDEVIAQLRRDPQLASISVSMMTAKAEESDELVGFALGADDYITKPAHQWPNSSRPVTVYKNHHRWLG